MDFFGHIKIKWPYVTHRVDRSVISGIMPMTEEPDPGRLVLARVISIGKHKEFEGTNGRRITLFPDVLLPPAVA